MTGGYRKYAIRWIESAKRPETREARIKRLIQGLKNHTSK
jgi:hypothetical protein